MFIVRVFPVVRKKRWNAVKFYAGLVGKLRRKFKLEHFIMFILKSVIVKIAFVLWKDACVWIENYKIFLQR